MDKTKLIMYSLLGFFGLTILLGIILIFRQAAVVPTAKEQRKIDFAPLGKEGIAIVHVYGDIFVEAQNPVFPGFSGGADQIVERLRRLGKNDKVKAVVLRLNSPGGSTGASQEIYAEVKKLKAAGKKIVVSMGDIAASGAYYIACPADRIIANPGTVTGSIGVIFHFGNLQELFKKIGVKIEVIKSGKNKDIGAYWRSLSDEERTLLQDLINNSYDQFVKAVSEGRNMPEEKVRELADGRIFTGEQALNKGLVDKLGNFPDAIKEAAQLAGIEGEPYIIKDFTPVERFIEIFGRQYEENSLSKIFQKTNTRLAYTIE